MPFELLFNKFESLKAIQDWHVDVKKQQVDWLHYHGFLALIEVDCTQVLFEVVNNLLTVAH